jgi:hypothetical protein
MPANFKLISAAVALALSASVAQARDFDDMVSLRGFGTVGVVHSTEDQADFHSTVFQPDGAGYTRDWDMRSDSRLAGQANVYFTDKLTLTVQALAQYQYDRTFTPKIEWANLKYSFTPELSVRVGRTALPTFLVSESRMVGYANTWVRPPLEVYQASSITSSDGVDVSYSFSSGRIKNTLQALHGSTEADTVEGVAEADAITGVAYLAEIGSASFRATYITMDLSLEIDSLLPLVAGIRELGGALSGFGFSTEGAQALSMAEKYRLDDMNVSFLSLGGTYDPGKWFVTAELIDVGGDGFLSDTRAGYLTAGARFGKFTPYATVAKAKADIANEPGISTTGLPGPFAAGAMALNAGVNMTLGQFQGSQESAAVGLRWDAISNVALKAQYDYVENGDNSAGKLTNPQPGFEYGSDYSLFSLTVDFIF